MPVSSPPYIPQFGVGAPFLAAPNGTIYYDTGAAYSAYIRNAGAWQPVAAALAGGIILKPKWVATQIASQNITSGVATKVNLPSALIDTNSNFDTVNSRFVCSVPGYYRVDGTVRGAAGSSNVTAIAVSFYVNGVEQRRVASVACPSTAAFAASGGSILLLAANDFVELWGNVIGTGPAFNFSGSAGSQCWFSGHMIGAGNN